MGNSDSGFEDANKSNTFNRLSQEYTHLRTETNKRYDSAQLYKSNIDPSKIVLVRHMVFMSDAQSNELKSRLEQYKRVEDPHLCKLIDYSFSTSKEFCHEKYLCTAVFEFTEDCLQDVMSARRKSMNTAAQGAPKRAVGYFTEHEAWTVLSQIMQGLSSLNDMQLFFGDVQPNNIMVFNRNTLQIKLFDPKYCLAEKTAYRRKLNNNDCNTPLCPNGLRELRDKNQQPRFAPDKAEVFSIGITMLSMLFCEDFNCYYDYKDYTIDFEQIGSKLGKLAGAGYSKELLTILETMLIEEEYKRPNISRLAQTVLTCPKNTYITIGPSQSNSTSVNSYQASKLNDYSLNSGSFANSIPRQSNPNPSTYGLTQQYPSNQYQPTQAYSDPNQYKYQQNPVLQPYGQQPQTQYQRSHFYGL